MPSNVGTIQTEVFEFIDGSTNVRTVEQGIPDTDTVLRNEAGKIITYNAVQISGISEGTVQSFAGPRGHDYNLRVRVQTVAHSPAAARGEINKITDAMLGEDFPYTGSIAVYGAGDIFTITASNGATEAYVAAASFTIPIQFESV
jgi:hypothetical protein